MRASVTSLTKKLISTFFAATLAMGLVPAAAFAASEDATIAANETTEEESPNSVISTGASESERSGEISSKEGIQEEPVVDAPTFDDESIADNAAAGNDSNLSIPAALERINEDVALTQPVAQQESTRSYFLAQTLESTKTVPIVSANLPLDKGASTDVAESDIEGEGNDASEEEGGEDSDESDPGVISTEASDSERSGEISAASTVIGSFEYQGIVYAIEPGGETVSVVASDYNKLPEQFVEKQTIVLPSAVTADYIDFYSVSRIADYAFASLTSEAAATCVISTEASESERSGEISPEEEADETVGITTLGIPASITSIGDDAFAGFDTLQYIVVEEGNPSFASYNGALYSADLTNLRLIPEGRVGTIRVAPSATTVEPEAFSHCPSVDTVVADPASEIYSFLETSLEETEVTIEALSDSDDNPVDVGGISFANESQLFDNVDQQVSTRAVSAALFSMIFDTNYGNMRIERYKNGNYSASEPGTLYLTEEHKPGLYPLENNYGCTLFADGTACWWITDSNWNLATFYRGGYTAIGWTDSVNTVLSSDPVTAMNAVNGRQYAVLWEANTYTFIWDANGGKWSDGATTKKGDQKYGQLLVLCTVDPKRDGYTFAGWYTERTGGTQVTSSNWVHLGGATYYAHWTNATYTITWNMNNASATAPSKTSYTYGDTYSLPAVSTYKDKGNKDLEGWYTNSACTTKASDITATTFGNLTFYAKWKAATYTITWNMNNASATAPSKTSYTYGETYTLPDYKDKDKKDLEGWYTNSACTTKASDITATTSGNKTFYAKWKAATYTITWNMNNSSATAPSKTSYTYGETYTLPDYKSADKKDLEGWYTNSACTTKASDITATTSGNKTFYAKWKTATYSITWNMNNASASKPSKTSYSYGETYTLPDYKDKDHKDLEGWYTDSACTTKASNITATTSGDLTFYAKWKTATYTITWNMNNSSATAPTKTTYTYGSTYTLPDVSTYKDKDHKDLEGWYTNSGLTTKASNITTTTSGNLTFYAKWNAATYTITWNMNNSSATAPSKTTYTYGSTYTLPDVSTYKDKDHKDLEGWYTNSGLTTKASNITATTSGNLTFYAKWNAATYTITWVMNNSSASAPAKTSYTYGSTYTLPALSEYKDKGKKDLVGWYENAALSAAASNIVTTSSGDKTFYAKWTNATYTITWHMNNSSASDPAKTNYVYGTTYTLPALSDYKDKDKKDLEGWYANSACTTKASNITATTSGNLDFYAKWNAATYTITWNMNNASATAPTKTNYVYGTTYTLPALSDYKDKDKKDLEGWYTNSACTTKASNITTTTSGNLTFYAKWNAATYTITWNMMGHGEDQKPTKTSYTYGEAYPLPPINDVEGWDFKGWYADPGYASAALDITATTYGNKSVYAKWERAQYKITYVMKGHGTAPTSPTGWTYGTPPTLKDPDKVEGWTFGGWYADDACSDGKKANITATSSSDITLYAKWTINKHTVYWKYGGADGKTDYKVDNVDYHSDVYMIDPGKKAGWKFAGWQASGADTSPYGYGNNEKMTMPDGDVILTAQWTKLDRIAVNLADKHLGEATGKIWYWPEKGYVTEEDPTFTVEVGSVIAAPPSVSGYQFLGWYATEDQNDNDDPMIDGEGKLRATSALSKVTTWYAHWKWVSCPVELKAEYDDIPYVTSAGDPTSIPYARFDVEFNKSLEGGKLKALPKRTGYTFMGYYTEANPEVSKADAEDATKFEGTQWIDRNGNLSENKWNEYPTDKQGSFTLYAVWRLDDCNVSFNVRDNVAPNTETVVVANEASLADKTWNYGKPKGYLPVASSDTFFRNGYTFGGWYYLKDASGSDVESNRVFVSDAQGNPTPANWDVVKTSVTLYPAWTAKKYKLVFDANYPKIDGVEAPEKTEKSIEVYYDAELDLSGFTLEFFPFTFAGWYTKNPSQFFEGTHMTDNGDGTKRFTPRGTFASMSQIDLIAHWNRLDEATYTLFWKIPGQSEIQQSVHDYGFTDTVQFNGTAAPAAPAGSGYRFEGWVEMDSYKEAMDALASDRPYMEGDTVSGWKPISNWDRFFVAKWTERAFSVSFSTTPHEATSNGESWLMATDTLENWKSENGEAGDALSWSEACALANQKDPAMATGIFYNIDMPDFVLPDVKRRGQVFEGWKLLDADGNPTGTATRGVVVEPSKQDVQGMRDLVYVPVFKDALYTIVLDANVYGEEQRFEDVPYSGEFTFPYPATLSTGSVFVCWGEDTNTNSDGTEKFYPTQTVKLAPTYNEIGEMSAFGLAHLANDENEITLYAVWNNATYNVEVPLFANLAIDTDRGDVIAGVNTIAPDPDNEDQTAVYRIESIRYEPLKNGEGVYAFQREGTPSDKIYLSVYAGLDTGEATDTEHLLYADNIDENGEVTYTDAKGDTAKAKPLLIELGGTTPVVYGRTAPEGQASLESVTGKTGFVTFGANNPLTIRYGLFFEDEQTRKDFAFGGKYAWLLPEADTANKSESIDPTDGDYGRRTAWSGNTVDIAKLHYTVSLVGDTK